MRIEVYSDGSIRHPIQLYFILHDDPTWRQDPEVHPLWDKHFVNLTEAWQRYCFELIKQENKGGVFTEQELKGIYNGMFDYHKAMSNHQGYNKEGDPRADFINGDDLNAGLPKIATLVMGGNVVAGREERAYDSWIPSTLGGQIWVGGEAWLWVDTMNGNDSPPSISKVNRQTHPELVQYGTIIKWDGKVIRFPDMVRVERNIYLETPYPIVALKPVKIELSKLLKLPIGSLIPNHLRG